MKLEEKIKDKKRDLERLDENYCVWLTRRAPIWRIGFDYNLYVITGNDPKKVVISYTEDPLNVWYRELRKNKRARLELNGRTWLTEAAAAELRDKVVACGGKAELGTFYSEEELEGRRKKIKFEIQQLEQMLSEQKAELKRKAAEDRASALAQGAISPEQLALVEAFFGGRDVEYVINKNGEVNVYGDIILDSDDLVNDEIPFPFGKVEGDFDCSGLLLETLRNAPRWVGAISTVPRTCWRILSFVRVMLRAISSVPKMANTPISRKMTCNTSAESLSPIPHLEISNATKKAASRH